MSKSVFDWCVAFLCVFTIFLQPPFTKSLFLQPKLKLRSQILLISPLWRNTKPFTLFLVNSGPGKTGWNFPMLLKAKNYILFSFAMGPKTS